MSFPEVGSCKIFLVNEEGLWCIICQLTLGSLNSTLQQPYISDVTEVKCKLVSLQHALDICVLYVQVVSILLIFNS